MKSPNIPPEARPLIDPYGRLRGWFFEEGSHARFQFPGFAAYEFEPEANVVTAVFGRDIAAAQVVETYERSILPLVMYVHGYEVLHASAIKTACGVVAFVAAARTGKSTLAYALTCRGFGSWADDVVVFRPTGDEITAVPLPVRPYLRTSARAFLKDRAPVSGAPESLTAAAANDAPVTLGTICVLQPDAVDSPPSRKRSFEAQVVPKTDAFSAIIKHAWRLDSDPERKARSIRCYLELAARTPVVSVRYAWGFDALSWLLDGIEQRVIGR